MKCLAELSFPAATKAPGKPLVLLVLLLAFPPLLGAEVSLPTPLEHYDNPAPPMQTLSLISSLLSELDPGQQAVVVQLLGSAKQEDGGEFPIAELLPLLKNTNWERRRPQVLEHLLHSSHVLEVVPEDYGQWLPIVHDALLFFLDHLGEERLLERILVQTELPDDAQRARRLLSFLSNTPTLQKIGQILARNPNLPQDLRQSLQVLENSLQTISPEELVDFVVAEIGPETIQEYQIEFSDTIIAEATVGAVMRCRFTWPQTTRPREAVLKMIKPRAVAAMREELSIFDELTNFFDDHRDFYSIGGIPLSDMFKELREALHSEIQVVDEQGNLRRAREYYRSNKEVLVPELLPFSSERVTFMEFVDGEKISDAFLGQAQPRSRMAQRLVEVMTVDVLLSDREEAIFHGDPHAGNVFHVLNDLQDPYRIALLDWGLSGVMARRQRESMMQLLLGVHLGDSKRLTNHLGAIVEGEKWKSPREQPAIQRIIDETLSGSAEGKVFDILGELMKQLSTRGYQIRFNISLFIKSQITISGILAELDPELKQKQYLMHRVSRQVLAEIPKRVLYTLWFPAWNSHDYRSMLSNEDVKDLQVRSSVRLLKATGNGIWSAVRWPIRLLR